MKQNHPVAYVCLVSGLGAVCVLLIPVLFRLAG